MTDRDRRRPGGTPGDYREVLADIAAAYLADRTPEDVQRERHERERAELAAHLAERAAEGEASWWRRVFGWLA